MNYITGKVDDLSLTLAILLTRLRTPLVFVLRFFPNRSARSLAPAGVGRRGHPVQRIQWLLIASNLQQPALFSFFGRQ